jgi:hypothetical protein
MAPMTQVNDMVDPDAGEPGDDDEVIEAIKLTLPALIHDDIDHVV